MKGCLFNVLAAGVVMVGLALVGERLKLSDADELADNPVKALTKLSIPPGAKQVFGQQPRRMNPENIRNCADLQRYAAQGNWSTKTTFQGFNRQEAWLDNYKNCRGYVTTESPMGKKVCDAYLEYRPNTDDLQWRALNYVDSCRWR